LKTVFDTAIKTANDDLADRYTKTESDARYPLTTELKTGLAADFNQMETKRRELEVKLNNTQNELSADLQNRYTKTESDARYPALATYNTDKASANNSFTSINEALTARYTKTESDALYPALATYNTAINDRYTKAEVDNRTNAINTTINNGLTARYTKTESDARYPALATYNTAINDRYTKAEVDAKEATVKTQMTSLVNTNTLNDLKPRTMWCADGELCTVPSGKKGFTNGKLTFTDNTIKNDNIGEAGRVHIGGNELLYVLNKNGVRIGKEWGGTGNLDVQGSTSIGETLNVSGQLSMSQPATDSFSQFRIGDNKFVMYRNGDTRTADGGAKTTTIRNNDGNLRLAATNGDVSVPQGIRIGDALIRQDDNWVRVLKSNNISDWDKGFAAREFWAKDDLTVNRNATVVGNSEVNGQMNIYAPGGKQSNMAIQSGTNSRFWVSATAGENNNKMLIGGIGATAPVSTTPIVISSDSSVDLNGVVRANKGMQVSNGNLSAKTIQADKIQIGKWVFETHPGTGNLHLHYGNVEDWTTSAAVADQTFHTRKIRSENRNIMGELNNLNSNAVQYNSTIRIRGRRGDEYLQTADAWDARTSSNRGAWERWYLEKE